MRRRKKERNYDESDANDWKKRECDNKKPLSERDIKN
jgi:hypothetical protein